MLRLLPLILLTAVLNAEIPRTLKSFTDKFCIDCHDAEMNEGELNIESLSFNLKNPAGFNHWVDIYDRVSTGEMPPKKKKKQPSADQRKDFLTILETSLFKADTERKSRAGIRRLNRTEYEESVRDLLNAPWLQIKDQLPEDGVAHFFNKSGSHLDVSHIQIEAYLKAAETAIDKAVNAAAHPTKLKKYYAREEPSNIKNLWYRFGQRSATRSTIPLLEHKAQPEVIRKKIPVTVGGKDPQTREKEAIGVVSGTYTATLKYDFKRVDIPHDGRYLIRIKSYTFMAGPNGRSGGSDHGLTTGSKSWWRPDRNVAFKGKRSEPITIYALKSTGDSRWGFTYDAKPDPTIAAQEIFLEEGETIRPDAGRLIRTRPGWGGNANATREGIPGYALNWLEVKGPLHEKWPPESYQNLFGSMPFKVNSAKEVIVQSENPEPDAKKLLTDFIKKAYRRPLMINEVDSYFKIYKLARKSGSTFTESVKAAFVAILCSPGFIYLEENEGKLESHPLASRLSYFLWNSSPDTNLRKLADSGDILKESTLIEETGRMLDDDRSEKFVETFLDYWLDLRDIHLNPPDATLYPDYYLDDQLTEASIFETRMFFKSLITENSPVTHLVDTDYTFVNERLAQHYGFKAKEGVELKKVKIPTDSPRGGLLTQASILRVTANGTTTSPVIRGAWISERILGIHVPEPPSGVEAIEPDTRGATTIREQLKKHSSTKSCFACHIKFDPVGFALENFDVAGGWQEKYRSTGSKGKAAKGIGKNGHIFKFKYHQPVDAAGNLIDGSKFKDIKELKALLVRHPRQLARNFVNRLVAYSTGAPVSFSDRQEVEAVLDKTASKKFGIRTLILNTVNSKIFKRK